MAEIWGPNTQIVLLFLFTVGGVILGWLPGQAQLRARAARAEEDAQSNERRAAEHRRTAEDLWKRCQAAEEQVRDLQLTVVQIPEIAQRLSGVRDLREIPEHALDLVQEIFQPHYAAFYRVSHGQLIAVARRGACEFEVGHQLAAGEGLVGWTAVCQRALRPEDVENEDAIVRQRNLDKCTPAAGFSLALPVVGGEKTLGVILIGPTDRAFPHAREIGRTIALLTAISITSTLVLRREQQLGETDGLTGLLNKEGICQRLGERLRADDPPAQVSVFLFDIDHFKDYNDSNGHLPGDELLRQVGRILAENSREAEHVGRYGGEEFLLVMEHVSKPEALKAAERIRAAVAEISFEAEGHACGGVTVSGGVATWPTDADDVDSLLEAVDRALRTAKSSGRDCVVAASDAALVTGGVSGDPLAIIDDPEKPDPEPDAVD